MSKTRKILLWTLIAYATFLCSWGAGMVISRTMASRFWSLLLFYAIYIAPFGLFLPLLVSRKFGIEPHKPRGKWRTIAGIGVFIVFIVFGVFFSDALPLISANPPTLAIIIKYLLLFIPMGLGITLQCFFLIPRLTENKLGSGWWSAVIAVIASGLALGVCFFVDRFFDAAPMKEVIEVSATMGALGLVCGTGALLTRSVYITAPVFITVMVLNTLSEAKYFDESWGALIAGFLLSALAVVLPLLIIKKPGRKFA